MKTEAKKTNKTKRYNTHPIVKASISLFLLIAVLSLTASFLFYKYSLGIIEEYEKKTAKAMREAYLEFTEKIDEGDGEGAAAALSRYALFFGDSIDEKIETVSNYLLNGSFSKEDSERINSIVSEYGDDEEGAIGKLADLFYDRVHERDAVSVGGEEEYWRVLREKAEVEKYEAKRIAEKFVGGGVTLTLEESHTFPLVYVYSCDNAVVEISRMGGRLISMWRYPLGSPTERTDAACRSAAREFVYEAGITGAYILNEEKAQDGIRYTFCGISWVGDEEAFFIDEKIEVTVNRYGARIVGFDASEYYKWRGYPYDKKRITVNRSRAMEMLGDGGEIRLTASHGALFWGIYKNGRVGGNDEKNGVGGVNYHLISAEDDVFEVKNP